MAHTARSLQDKRRAVGGGSTAAHGGGNVRAAVVGSPMRHLGIARPSKKNRAPDERFTYLCWVSRSRLEYRSTPMLDRFLFRVSEQIPAVVFTALAGAFGWALLAGWL